MRSLRRQLLVVIIFAATASCRPEEEPKPPPLRPVRYQEVYSTGGQRVRTFSGSAQADVETILSFRVSGNIQRRLVEIGDRVEAGQLIAELDPTDFELRVQEADASLIQAEARSRQAEADYDRVRGLYENRNASKADLDAARAAAESARAQIDASIKRLEQARSQLSYTRLRAPTAGWIASVSVEINENVGGGDEVAMLTAGSRPQVNVAVPESLISEIERGDDVEVTFDALPGRTFDARVTEVGVAAVEIGSTFPVSVQLRDETEDVRSGMAADVSFTFGSDEERERFWVPLHAVAEDRKGRFVYIVEPREEGRAVVKRKSVTVGELTAEGLEVLTGLEDGDRVVTAGVSQIHDGLVVKLGGGGADS